MGSIGSTVTSNISNTFTSRFGFNNVANLEEFRGFGGVTYEGTVKAGTQDVQQYLDTFTGYGSRAKKDIIKQIVRDMHGRGFTVSVSEDGNYIKSGDEVISVTRDRDGYWKAKTSRSAGTKTRGGMRGALDRASRR